MKAINSAGHYPGEILRKGAASDTCNDLPVPSRFVSLVVEVSQQAAQHVYVTDVGGMS